MQSRTESVLSLARLALAIFVFAAVWFDPSQPSTAPEATYAILAGYLVVAAVAAAGVRRPGSARYLLALAAHLVDIAVYTALLFLTDGPTSPYFLLFTFAMVGAAFRWGWRGAFWTSATVLAVLLLAAGLYAGFVPGAPFEVDRFIVRCTPVLVIGAMLVYFAWHQDKTATDLAKLTSWSRDDVERPTPCGFPVLALRHAADLFGAERVLLVLDDAEEPWATLLRWERGAVHRERLNRAIAARLVAPALGEATFLSEETAAESLVLTPSGQIATWRGDALSSALGSRCRARSVLSTPVRSQRCEGRLLVLDPPAGSADDLTVAALLGGQIAGGLDRMTGIDALRRQAAAEERLRIARDLHDGILQTLSGTALQLETLGALAQRDPSAFATRVQVLQDWLLGEQRSLRALIRTLRPGSPLEEAPAQAADSASDRHLIEGLEKHWGIAVMLDIEPADLALPAAIRGDIQQMIREAASNAVRHGKASRLSIRLASRQTATGPATLDLSIADNGRGLPVEGDFDQQQCAMDKLGPRSLRERVVALGGALVLHSSARGLCLDITLPIRTQVDVL